MLLQQLLQITFWTEGCKIYSLKSAKIPLRFNWICQDSCKIYHDLFGIHRVLLNFTNLFSQLLWSKLWAIAHKWLQCYQDSVMIHSGFTRDSPRGYHFGILVSTVILMHLTKIRLEYPILLNLEKNYRHSQVFPFKVQIPMDFVQISRDLGWIFPSQPPISCQEKSSD